MAEDTNNIYTGLMPLSGYKTRTSTGIFTGVDQVVNTIDDETIKTIQQTLSTGVFPDGTRLEDIPPADRTRIITQWQDILYDNILSTQSNTDTVSDADVMAAINNFVWFNKILNNKYNNSSAFSNEEIDVFASRATEELSKEPVMALGSPSTPGVTEATQQASVNGVRNIYTNISGLKATDAATATQSQNQTQTNADVNVDINGDGIADIITEPPVPESGSTNTGIDPDDAAMQLASWAYVNGVRDLFSDNVLKAYGKEISDGTITPAQAYQNMRNQLIKYGVYNNFSEELGNGMDPIDIATPYINAVASVLELDPSDPGLINDPLVQKALDNVSDGKPAYLPIWQVKEEARKDKRYQATDSYLNEVASLANQLYNIGTVNI